MDDRQALAIVTALANGADPRTGEVFPTDSPYQSPDVIRALFSAQRALEAKARASGNAPQPDPSSATVSTGARAPAANSSAPNTGKPSIGKPNTGKPNAGKPNAGKQWNADEDKLLLASFDGGKPLADIAREHGRTVGGVRARLEKHGRLEPSPATRWPVKEPEQTTARYTSSQSAPGGGSNGRARAGF